MALTPFMMGKHLTAITIAPITADASGTVSVGSPVDIRAYIASADGTASRDLEDVRPVWQLQKNMLSTGVGNALRLGVLQRSDAANAIETLAFSYERCQVAWQAGTGIKTGRYIIGEAGYGINGRGQNLNTLDLQPIGEGDTANMVLS